MRFFYFLIISLVAISCSSEKKKDFSELEKLSQITDSLIRQLQNNQAQISDKLYFVADDSVKRDSLMRELNLPDSTGFYRYIEKNLNDMNEVVFQTQQEIYFAKEQLNSIKTEYDNNNLSEKEYLIELDELQILIQFLSGRVDTNLSFMQRNYHLDTSYQDSIN